MGIPGHSDGQPATRNRARALRPLMRRAIHTADELHSRNTAATLLFTRALFPYLLERPRGQGTSDG